MLRKLYINWQVLIQVQNKVQEKNYGKRQYIAAFQNFRAVFINTSILSEHIRICKSVEEIEELNPDSTDIFERNMVERYTDTLNSQHKNGMYDIVDHVCFAIFAAHYPPDMRRHSDVSIRFHIGRDVADHIETSI